MCTNGIEYYCRHDVHKVRCDEEKINRVNTMTTIETISWSKTRNSPHKKKIREIICFVTSFVKNVDFTKFLSKKCESKSKFS